MNRGRARFVGLAVAVLALAVTLAACGATPEPTAELVAPTQPSEPVASPTEPEPTAVPATPTEVAPAMTPEEEVLFPASKPSAMRGEDVFAANCASCHGEAGDGSGLAGAADFTDVAFMREEKPAEFYQAIRDGVEGSAMPAWGDTLGEMEMWDVLYYAWSLATSTEELAQGQEQFSQLCVSCHGEAGDGSALEGAADFTDQAFMANEAPEEFYGAIDEGVPGSAMPAWGEQLEEDQIWALVNYVWTFAYEVPEAPAATAVPTQVEATETAPPPTETSAPVASPTPSEPEPDPVVGGRLWQEKPCSGCHGPQAMGNIGPRLAGTELTFDDVLLRVRTGKDPMPAFSEAEISDLELRHIYAWLQSLVVPTDTP